MVSMAIIETMDRLAIIQEKKIVETTVRILNEEKIQTMHRLARIQEQKIVKPTVRFSI